MEYPLDEILDKMSIVRLKIERIGEPHLREQYAEYERAILEYQSRGVVIRQEWLDGLREVNSKVWDLEADIRKGKENELGLEEVGKRAIAIRDLNKQRIAIKSRIVEETGIGFKDVKMNHASQL